MAVVFDADKFGGREADGVDVDAVVGEAWNGFQVEDDFAEEGRSFGVALGSNKHFIYKSFQY